MSDANHQARAYRFDAFEFDPRSGELRRQGKKVRLVGQPLEVLALLLERSGDLVRREELRTHLWPGDTFVDFEHSLNAAVNKLRDSLGDSAEAPKFIETLPRRGYRFIAPVEVTVIGPPTPSPEERPVFVKRHAALVGLVLASVAGAALLGWQLFRPRPVPASAPGRVLIAVLPFQNISGDTRQDYFSEGLTDELITELGDLNPERLGVIARNSAMAYQHSSKNEREIGRDLGAEYLLEGSVVRSGDRVRITAQLIRASDQTYLWARSYERNLSDIFAVQDDVARAVATQIEIKLDPSRRQFSNPGAINPAAYDAYLKTLYLCQRGTPDDIRQATRLLEQVTAADPRFAPVYAMLAFDYADLSGKDESPKEAMAKARTAALKALALDDHLAEAHAAFGFVKLYYDRDWAGAEKEYDRAAKLNPDSQMVHSVHAFYLAALGRFDDALAEIRREEQLDPLNLGWYCSEGRLLDYAHRYGQAIQAFQKGVKDSPAFAGKCLWLGLAYEQAGRYSDAIAALKKSVDASPGDTFAVGVLGRAYALEGNRAEARKQLNMLLALRKRRYVSSYDISLIDGGLGDRNALFQLIRKQLTDREGLLVYLNVDPLYDPYRSDPRFQSLLRRVGFP